MNFVSTDITHLSSPAGKSPVRVMTWNILGGFHHTKSRGVEHPPVFDEKSLAHARQILADHQPDVVILNEALWCQPADGHYVDYAHLRGYSHAVVNT